MSAVSDLVDYDVVVLGAGLAGLNALAVASGYVGQQGRVLLVDRRPGPGGMWNDTYQYVRLHQPHPFFTAADIRWTQGHRPEHLATKPEVLDHFRHCLQVIGSRTELATRFGVEYVDHLERDDHVELTLRDAAGNTSIVTTGRLVKAFGYDVATNLPLALSTDCVHSISPDEHDVRTGAIADDSAPVWIVGGGKTGMDTALALLAEQPGRDVRMLVGSGTAFADRDLLFPARHRRWTSGSRVNQWGIKAAAQFDGTNEEQVMRWMLDNGVHSPVDAPRDFFLGIMGRDELSTLRSGVTEFERDYLTDVRETSEGVRLELRSGTTRAVEPGTWFVNCTGYLARRDQPYEPFASPGGRVLTICDRSATSHLTSYNAYFLTHALMRGLLPIEDLYEVDLIDLRERAKPALGIVAFTLTLHTMGVMLDHLPKSVFLKTRLDFDAWYPMPRKLVGSARFVLGHRSRVKQHRAALDALRARGFRSGPLALQ